MRRKHWTVLAAFALIGAVACTGDAGEGDDGMDGDTADAAATPAGGTTGGTTTAANLPAGVTQAMVTQGREIFTGAGNCFTCHGMNGEGTQLAPNLTDSEWLNVDGQYESIVNLIPQGVPQPREHPAPMPPMGGAQLTDEQVRAVAAYVYSLAPRS